MAKSTSQQRAIDKAMHEVQKDLEMVISIARSCGTGELLFYLHYLHSARLAEMLGNIPEREKTVALKGIQRAEDVFKYLAQIVYKHGRREFIKNDIDGTYINPQATEYLTKLAMHISSNYEAANLFTLFDDLEVFGERAQTVKIDFRTLNKNDKLIRFFNYALRVSSDNDIQKSSIIASEDFLKYFQDRYAPYSDLFQKEFGLSVDDFTRLNAFVLDEVSTQIKTNAGSCVRRADGKIDIQAYGTIMLSGLSLFIEKQKIMKEFGIAAEKTIARLTFSPSQFDEKNLRYDLIARQPLLDYGETLLVSPELLLDSFLVNSHFSLLESSSLKDEYMQRYSVVFVDKLSEIADKYGFREICRGLELREGKKQIGDIDIVLANSQNQYLLIEAKNHAIPLDVYFHDTKATEERLTYLMGNWEKKVKRRDAHIKSDPSKYGIPSSYTYVIVTRFPEILSHFSEFLVLTTIEFEFWLKHNRQSATFQEIFDEIYLAENHRLTDNQLVKMAEDFQLRIEPSDQ